MNEERTQAGRTVGGMVVVGLAAASVLAAIELGYLWCQRGGVERGRLALVVPLLLLAAGAVLGLVEGLLVRAIGAGAAALGRRRPGVARWAAWLYTALATPFVAWGCAQLFRGRYARTIPRHDLIAVLVGVVLLALVYRVARLALEVGARLRRGRLSARVGLAASAALLGVAGLLYMGDVRLLPRLYPFFHWALAAGAVLAAQLAVGAFVLAAPGLRARVARLARPAAALALAAVALVGGAAALSGLSRSQGLRFQALERTAVTQKALAVAASTHVWRQRALRPAAGRGGATRAAALPPGPRLAGGDVILITMDAVRADHLGAYGYRRPTTPALDRLARSGVLFERAYCPTPHTSFSLSSLLTGQYTYSLTAVGAETQRATLPLRLRPHGYRSAGFFPPAVFFTDGHKLAGLEERRFDFEYVKYEYRDAAARTDQVIQYFDAVRPQRAFVWVHYFEPHEPYEPHPGHDFGAAAVDRYDSEIAYTDEHIGRLVTWVRRHRPHAVIIVTADHGEEFGDHGGHYHGSSVYDEQVRVPLIISAPGLTPRRVAMPVETVSVAPTVLGLLGVPGGAELRGIALGPWLGRQPAPPDAAPPAFGAIEQKKMVVHGTHKLICDLQRGFCELYDLATDPHERRNLIDGQDALAGQMRADLDGWMTSHLAGVGRPAALSAPERARQALERGRLGDAGAVLELAALLAGPDAAARRDAALVLRGLRADAARQALLGYLDDDDPEVANAAAAAGAVLAPAARRSARALLTEPGVTEDARVWAAIGLAEAGDAAGVPVLAAAVAGACKVVVDGSAADGRCVGSMDIELARYGVNLLRQLRDRRALDALLASRANVRLRREVVAALGALGDRRVALTLAHELATEPQVEPRAAIARALGRIGDPRVVPALAHAFAGETEGAAARELFRALSRLGGAAAGGAGAADLRRWAPAQPRELALVPARGERVSGYDLWLLSRPGGAGRLTVRVGDRLVAVLTLDGAERVYSVVVPPAAVPAQGPVRVALERADGEPRLKVAWLRALSPAPALAPAPASQWVPARQQAPRPAAAPGGGPGAL
ncbi:MAG TPA: sulfatase-like hydrolase/transferase [Polyangia bacterium]